MINMEHLRNMIISMRYQNGVEIDPDNMTYEELLQLEENMGSVCKGLTEEQIAQLPTAPLAKQEEDTLCSICYCNGKEGEIFLKLPCDHTFHHDCIK